MRADRNQRSTSADVEVQLVLQLDEGCVAMFVKGYVAENARNHVGANSSSIFGLNDRHNLIVRWSIDLIGREGERR